MRSVLHCGDLLLIIFLLLSCECWDYKFAPPHPVLRSKTSPLFFLPIFLSLIVQVKMWLGVRVGVEWQTTKTKHLCTQHSMTKFQCVPTHPPRASMLKSRLLSTGGHRFSMITALLIFPILSIPFLPTPKSLHIQKSLHIGRSSNSPCFLCFFHVSP